MNAEQMGDRGRRAGEDDESGLKEYVLFAPRIVKLVYRLMRDSRVPYRPKAMLVFLSAYLASPIDVLPDFIPGIGQLDDLVLAAFVLDQILNRVPDHIVREHWDGDEDVLQIIREILDVAASVVVPEWLKKRLRA
jgi:uncharacterized membrane protein YkvA (DUF1232 family)